MNDDAEWIAEQRVNESIRRLKEQVETVTVEQAFGSLYLGYIEKARGFLRKLPPEKLAEVSVVAAALSSLADEIASETNL